MTTPHLIDALRRKGVVFIAPNCNTLKIRAPENVLTVELVKELRDRKAEILASLKLGKGPSAASRPSSPRQHPRRVVTERRALVEANRRVLEYMGYGTKVLPSALSEVYAK